jgi:FkbM family methyltransferase
MNSPTFFKNAPMDYSSSIWKHKMRSGFYNLISPRMYIAIMPAWLKLFSKKRRNCTYRFEIADNGRIILSDRNTRFMFVGYRRINRYLYPQGLERKMASMKKKYCYAACSIEPGDIVVEIGANVGEFTLMAAGMAKRVYSFEPDPNCNICINDNTRTLINVEVLDYAASNTTGSNFFYIASEDADSSLIEPRVYSGKVEVKTVRLDEWMQSRGISEIDFLKVEAEGAEIEVLEGLGEKIHSVRKVSVDGGPERYGQPTSEDVDRFLKAKGFITELKGYHVYAWRA